MIKKVSAVLLALMLLLCAVQPAFAQTPEDGWLLYVNDRDPAAVTAVFIVPAKYTRLSEEPLIGATYEARPDETYVYVPEAGRLPFYFNGITEEHWTLTVTFALPDGAVAGYDFMFAVLPGSVLDDAGNGNPRVFFEDGTEYLVPGGYAGIDVYSGLLERDYERDESTVAVGDTLRVDYSGLYPVEIRINGERAAALPAGEMQRFTYPVTNTGALSVAVYQNGTEIAARTLTVITSREMYERNLRDGLITSEDIPSTADLIDVGVPAGSPFIILAKLIAFFNGVAIFFRRLFSFPRIAN